jgi:hypothetical protein
MIRLFLPLVLVLSTFIGVSDIIEACIHNESGAIRIVSADTTCADDETRLEWNVLGPKGETGPPGPAGPPGVGDLGCTAAQIIRWDEAIGQWSCSDELADLQARIAVLENLLTHVSRTDNTLVISGANLQVVNGTGSTETANGLGNLIIGYNEERSAPEVNERTGSHVLVVGIEHNYSSVGGIVVGLRHTISGTFAAISGGSNNIASGSGAAVSGGSNNIASGANASVSGGSSNTASSNNASVSGGEGNIASGANASVSGGLANTASGARASVSGGYGNTASGFQTTVGGGRETVVNHIYDWAAGDLYEPE